jgi:hypothetical protein
VIENRDFVGLESTLRKRTVGVDSDIALWRGSVRSICILLVASPDYHYL